MSALLPADLSVVLTIGQELNVEELTLDSTEVVVVNATMPMVLSYDLVKGDTGSAGPPGPPSTVPGPPGVRGSIWFTGSGPLPSPLSGAIPGDYYLDNVTGNYYLLS
jgi:hypothetical protein